MPVMSTSLANDAAKFIQDTLIARSVLIHKLPQFAEDIPLDPGNGKTANMIKYNRTDVPLSPLTEGTTPAETPFTITTQSVTVNEWGMFISLTDVGIVTTKHPVLNEALDLIADAIARVKDFDMAETLVLGTNVQYWDGTDANRAAISAGHTFKAAVFNKARAALNNAGTPTREGDFFVAVLGPSVEADFFAETAAVGSFTAAHQLQGVNKLEMGTVGTWLGFKIVRSNFMQKWTNQGAGGLIAPTAVGGGSLSGTVFYKVTRKNTQRGFEEDIQPEASVAMGANTALSFVAPGTTGFVYNVYAGTTTGDGNLFLAQANVAAGATFLLTSLPGSGVNPPATPATGVAVNPIYVFGLKAVDKVALNALSMNATITPKAATDSDPLQQRRKVGAKYANKNGIRDQQRILRIELASNF